VHIAYYCRNRRDIEESRRIEIGGPEFWLSNNGIKVLMSRVIQIGILNKLNSSSINTDGKEKKKKLLREVMVKIELKQEDDEDRITIEALLDSSMIELVMSLEFVRKNKFKKKKLEIL